MIQLQTPQTITLVEAVTATVHHYQITGFQFKDDSSGTHMEVALTAYNVDGGVVRTTAYQISSETLSAHPAYQALHDQVRDALESYLVENGVINA